jgi:DNA-binding NtrC family response regulator
MEKILLVDDNEPIRKMIRRVFEKSRYEITEADTLKLAHDILDSKQFDLIITDLKLPDGEGTELLKRRNLNKWLTEIIIITAYGDVATAVNAMKSGAFDFVIKPLNIDEFEVKVAKAIEESSLKKSNEKLQETINCMVDSEGSEYNFVEIIGDSVGINDVKELIKKVSKTDASILITGESGVGKELAARAIHFNSKRKNKPFIKVNCAVFSEGILESELFGHEKGAFTGAFNKRLGRFEVADEGTIFLDEIGDLPMNTQVKLLQVLQEFTFERVGGNEPIKVDVRVIAATNQDLKKKIKNGTFREDLFYRVNVVPVCIPPLRKRRGDIEILIKHYIEKFSEESKNKISGISKETLKLFKNYSWPGNVRELEHIIERMVILTSSDELQEDDIPEEIIIDNVIKNEETLKIKGNLKDFLDNYEKKIVIYYLDKYNYDRKEVAKQLGIKLSTLYSKIEKYNLK